jgi:hypothetical protein
MLKQKKESPSSLPDLIIRFKGSEKPGFVIMRTDLDYAAFHNPNRFREGNLCVTPVDEKGFLIEVCHDEMRGVLKS